MIRLVLLALLSLYIGAYALETPVAADSLFHAEQYEAAAAAYSAHLKINPADGQSFWRLGYCNHHLEKFQDAIDSYKQADSLGFAKAMSRYNMSCAYARLGETAPAIAWLDSAYAVGFAQFDMMKADSDLESLLATREWAEFIARTEKILRPCLFDTRYRQFDFWEGEWIVVMTQGGQYVGQNSVTRKQAGCLLHEAWTSLNGNTGESINFFNPETQKWNQLWTDARGSYTIYEGEFKDGAMRFDGRNYDFGKTEKPDRMRMTLTPNDDGSVQQFIEIQNVETQEWQSWFDGTYKRKDK